ncbi:hypothetical protein BB776_00145 [Planococcus salinarum]|uniref:Uncharacterized protein n=1 Tax=Planococcus salinarum TaxID=622695 RepID=A0ABX3D202_9BACL|nr:hypothetical protein BB776_00145 [Planococcus salinarum]
MRAVFLMCRGMARISFSSDGNMLRIVNRRFRTVFLICGQYFIGSGQYFILSGQYIQKNGNRGDVKTSVE